MKIYHFPSNRRAEDLDLEGQLLKISEECREVLDAYLNNEGRARIIEELWDLIQAVEGALRKFLLSEVIRGFARVKLKSAHRGDYARWEE